MGRYRWAASKEPLHVYQQKKWRWTMRRRLRTVTPVKSLYPVSWPEPDLRPRPHRWRESHRPWTEGTATPNPDNCGSDCCPILEVISGTAYFYGSCNTASDPWFLKHIDFQTYQIRGSETAWNSYVEGEIARRYNLSHGNVTNLSFFLIQFRRPGPHEYLSISHQ